MHQTFHRNARLLLVSAALALTAAFSALRPPAIHAQSQTAMNMQSGQAFKVADADLNAAYKRLLARIDKKSQAKLQATQRAWIAFRDAQSDLHADVMARGGTMEPMDRAQVATALTQTRTRELEAMTKELSSR